MTPFMRTVSACPRAELKDFKKVTSDDRHNIQTHVDYLSMLVSAHTFQGLEWVQYSKKTTRMAAQCWLLRVSLQVFGSSKSLSPRNVLQPSW